MNTESNFPQGEPVKEDPKEVPQTDTSVDVVNETELDEVVDVVEEGEATSEK